MSPADWPIATGPESALDGTRAEMVRYARVSIGEDVLMAAVNDLIEQVENPELRERLRREVDKLNKQKKNRFKRLDLAQGATREKVIKAQNIEELDHIFDTEGYFK